MGKRNRKDNNGEQESNSLHPELSNDIRTKSKKRKHNIQEQEIVNKKSLQRESIDHSKKNLKKRNQSVAQKLLINEESLPQESQSELIQICKSSKKKQKVNLDKNEVLNDKDSLHKISVNLSKKDKKKNTGVTSEKSQLVTSTDNNKKNKNKKKPSIEEAVVQNVETNNDNDNDSKKTKKKKKRNIVEEVINDEDIDKYCDELDPVHNEQYEDWIKLIDANLSSNKKK